MTEILCIFLVFSPFPLHQNHYYEEISLDNNINLINKIYKCLKLSENILPTKLIKK